MIPLHDLLLDDDAGSTPVCIDGAVTLDRAAFRSRVLAIAAAWRGRMPTRYALCIDDPFDFACAMFALLACAKHPVVPASHSPDYLASLAEDFDAIITDADLAGLRGGTAPEMAHAIDADAALTLYTSGSSGAPKPIRKTLSQFDAEVRTLEAQWGALAGDATVLGSVPHHHIYGLLFRVFWPLAAGRPFDRALCHDPQQLDARLAACDAGIAVSTPAQLARWPWMTGFASLARRPRAFFSSGGPLDADTAGTYRAAFDAAPLEVFGSTETGGIAWRRQDQSDAWQALPGIAIERDMDGALLVRSPHLGHDDWHRTDDAVAFDADGRFRLNGRLDRVVKLDGKRVSLPELEARLALHPYVARAAVAVLETTSRQRAGAVVALTGEGHAALAADGRVALAKALRRHLAGYFDLVVLPRHWRFPLALPCDARGKTPAAAIAAAFDARAEGFELLSICRDGDACSLELRVPPGLAHFAGHFPGLPILPGVVQLDWAVRLATECFDETRDVASIDRLKFMAPVGPGALLALRLSRDSARGRVQFAYRLGRGAEARDCASGAIVYGSAA
ncbi:MULTISPECIES: AMP-binding protein [unclassified Caballeronia]|uniref:AMP-binding protein n=1 Tax=unclassified Caballeronia TaxID=2646786 RepID=UPI00286511D9|nr:MULTISPECIES: AMP-binding protein [unclassified Caballeronia]MDR5754212.1 AMP-binding protein [Caballeronia sp. LZ024]MDR5840590.1 AMP-binding protein [Caballeronia sp. LZ031]